MHDDATTFDPDAARAAYERGRQILTETPLRTVPVTIAPPYEVTPAAPQPLPPIPLDPGMLSVSIIDRARLTISNLPRTIMEQYRKQLITVAIGLVAFGVKQMFDIEVSNELQISAVGFIVGLIALFTKAPGSDKTPSDTPTEGK